MSKAGMYREIVQMDIEESKEAREKGIDSLLQICKKAGKLSFGMDAGMKTLNKGICKLLLLSVDLSAKNRDKLVAEALKMKVSVFEYSTKKRIGSLFNRRETGILAITDSNFARGLMKKLETRNLLEANWEV